MTASATPSHTPGVTVLVTQLSRLIYRRTSEDLLGMRVKEFASRLRNVAPSLVLGPRVTGRGAATAA